MKNSALDVCVFIFNNIGAENYLQLMNYALEPQKAEEMRQAMETHRTQKIKQPQLSEVIKHQKMTNNRESGVWSQNLRMWSSKFIDYNLIVNFRMKSRNISFAEVLRCKSSRSPQPLNKANSLSLAEIFEQWE